MSQMVAELSELPVARNLPSFVHSQQITSDVCSLNVIEFFASSGSGRSSDGACLLSFGAGAVPSLNAAFNKEI